MFDQTYSSMYYYLLHTAEPLVPEPSAFEVELAIEKLKSHKSPGIHQIPAELIKAGSRTIHSQFHKLIISIWNKEELPESGKSRSLYLSTRRAVKQIVVIIGAYHFCQLHKNSIQHPAVKVNSICRGNYWGSSRWISTKQVNY